MSVASLAAAERASRGLPDGRDREPGADEGWRWLPWRDGPPQDLLQLAQLEAAVREGNDLAFGVAIPGAPGACASCHHAKTWHAQARHACGLCACRRWTR